MEDYEKITKQSQKRYKIKLSCLKCLNSYAINNIFS